MSCLSGVSPFGGQGLQADGATASEEQGETASGERFLLLPIIQHSLM